MTEYHGHVIKLEQKTTQQNGNRESWPLGLSYFVALHCLIFWSWTYPCFKSLVPYVFAYQYIKDWRGFSESTERGGGRAAIAQKKKPWTYLRYFSSLPLHSCFHKKTVALKFELFYTIFCFIINSKIIQSSIKMGCWCAPPGPGVSSSRGEALFQVLRPCQGNNSKQLLYWRPTSTTSRLPL